MEMHQVRYFLAVARTLNFTKAADECHVAQPSLSRAIKKLEEELGGDLFRRERSLSHLTELGRTMLPVLSQCYDSAETAKSIATSLKKGGASVPLRLALSHTINMQLLLGARTEVVKAYSGLAIHFDRGTAREVEERLKNGDVELGVACPLADAWDRLESSGTVPGELRSCGSERQSTCLADRHRATPANRTALARPSLLRAVCGICNAACQAQH